MDAGGGAWSALRVRWDCWSLRRRMRRGILGAAGCAERPMRLSVPIDLPLDVRVVVVPEAAVAAHERGRGRIAAPQRSWRCCRKYRAAGGEVISRGRLRLGALGVVLGVALKPSGRRRSAAGAGAGHGGRRAGRDRAARPPRWRQVTAPKGSPYGMTEAFERVAVYLACSSPRFWSLVGYEMAPEASGLPESKLLLEVAHSLSRDRGGAARGGHPAAARAGDHRPCRIGPAPRFGRPATQRFRV